MSNKANATRDKILDAAQSLMMTEGFHGVTVDRIIEAAQISKGSFFYHFVSKDELPTALLERFISAQGEGIRQILAHLTPVEDPLEKATQLADGLIPLFTYTCDERPGCLMAAFSYQLTTQFPAITQMSAAAIDGWQKGLACVFEPFATAAEASGESLALQLLDVLQGASIAARIQNNPKTIHIAVKHFKLYLTLLHQRTRANKQ